MKILSVITLATLALFLVYPTIDLDVSRLFYVEGQGFIYRDTLFSQILYKSVRFITAGVLAICIYCLIYDHLKKFIPSVFQPLAAKVRGFIKFKREHKIFVFLVIVITPGILVHWVMKPAWDRARPVNVTEFGGTYEYTNFYHIRAGQDGKSFPSGHASMSFSLLAFAYIVSTRNRKKVLIAAYSYGIIASACRVWQGGHFLSDVTFSALITIWTILLVKKYYLDRYTKLDQKIEEKLA